MSQNNEGIKKTFQAPALKPNIKSGKPSRSTSPISMFGLLFTIAAVILTFFSIYSLFIILFGMMPSFVATVVDREPKRNLTRIIASFNLAGIAPYIITILFNLNHANKFALQYIFDVDTWLFIYASALLGWIVFWALPNTLAFCNNIRISFKIFELNNELNKLSEEWGEDIKKK